MTKKKSDYLNILLQNIQHVGNLQAVIDVEDILVYDFTSNRVKQLSVLRTMNATQFQKNIPLTLTRLCDYK